MNIEIIQGCLQILKQIENLKNIIRTFHTSQGRPESTAEYTWRLAMFAMIFADEMADLDLLKVIQMCKNVETFYEL